MAPEKIQDWNVGDKAGLISIGTHRLHLSVSGPERKAGEPIVIVIVGCGASIWGKSSLNFQ